VIGREAVDGSVARPDLIKPSIGFAVLLEGRTAITQGDIKTFLLDVGLLALFR